jgi:hypothetical protein
MATVAVRRRCGVFRIEDCQAFRQGLAKARIGCLSDDDIIACGRMVSSESQGSNAGSSLQIPVRLVRMVRRAVARPERLDAARGVLQASWSCCDDEEFLTMIDDMNRQLADIASTADSPDDRYLQRVEDALGGQAYSMVRLILECQTRIRRGVPGPELYRGLWVMPVAEWDWCGNRILFVLCWVSSAQIGRREGARRSGGRGCFGSAVRGWPGEFEEVCLAGGSGLQA